MREEEGTIRETRELEGRRRKNELIKAEGYPPSHHTL